MMCATFAFRNVIKELIRKDDHIWSGNGNLEFRWSFLDYFQLYGLKNVHLLFWN